LHGGNVLKETQCLQKIRRKITDRRSRKLPVKKIADRQPLNSIADKL
jgi:hypothetical protein